MNPVRYAALPAFTASPFALHARHLVYRLPSRISPPTRVSFPLRTRACTTMPDSAPSVSATPSSLPPTPAPMPAPGATSSPFDEDAPLMGMDDKWLSHRSDVSVPVVGPGNDWISPLRSELQAARDFRPAGAKHTHPPRVLVLYGTLRPTGFSKALGHECARLGELLGMEMRVFDPQGLPVRDPALQEHPKVVELRSLVAWSEGHVWVGAELHGALCSVFKNQIDWIPLNTASIRPTQGKACVVLQVCGGSQSFNVVNALRLLARWMRMTCVVNQSSVPMAWKQFDDDGRMKDSSLRHRVVDVMEEFVKTVRVNREYADMLTDRYSERKEREEKGRLLTQAEKEAEKDKKNAANATTPTTTTTASTTSNDHTKSIPANGNGSTTANS